MRIVLFLLATLLPVFAQETMIREVHDPKTDTHVEVLALFTQPSRGGFFPVRVKISNNQTRAHTVRLNFSSTVNYDERIETKSTFTFTAEAGKAATRDILVPLVTCPASYGDLISVKAELSGSLGKAENTIRTTTTGDGPGVLLSEALFTPNASSLDAASVKGSRSSYGNNAFAAKFDPKQLPADWLAFSGYDTVMMTDKDWSDAPAGSRNAILSWMYLGGNLILYSSSGSTPATLGLPKDPSYGSHSIRSVGTDLKLDAVETVKLVGSGSVVPIRHTSLQNDFSTTWPLQQHFGSQEFNYGLFIAVLIFFGILVGPINLFVLAKSGQRHRLFITTPLISLGASLLLIALIIFQDGFGGHGMRRILMEVRPDAGQNASFLHQEQFSRTGILTRSHFQLDPACLFTPAPIAKSRWSRYTNDYNTRGSFHLQPSDGKLQASGDWWQSRSEHGHSLTAVVSTRGRIERASKPSEMVSTFDFPIDTLYYLDDAGQWHRAESITTGTPFQLTPVDATMVEPALALEVNGFTNRNRGLLERARKRPGHFVAITSSAPAIDTHPGIRWKETRTVITGPVVAP